MERWIGATGPYSNSPWNSHSMFLQAQASAEAEELSAGAEGFRRKRSMADWISSFFGPDVLTRFYGTDWIAMVLTFASIYMLGEKKKNGFIVGVAANFAWMAFSLISHSGGSLIANIVILCLNIRGYYAWRAAELDQAESTS